MMRFGVLFALFSCFLMGMSACGDSNDFVSTHPNAAYFYAFDTVPKIYLYRDVTGGLEEEFHRIYSLKDHAGAHLIVEVYASDGRLREAFNYNIDSLDVQDYMVVDVNQEKEKTLLYKDKLYPSYPKEKTWFAAKFRGVVDSTIILSEVKRTIKTKKTIPVMDDELEALVLNEDLRMSILNPFTQKEKELKGKRLSYFAKGLGLVEWHSMNKQIHYRLEQILTQQEWIKMIAR
jgi:outer membrane receptor for Fe3+-dicitrate